MATLHVGPGGLPSLTAAAAKAQPGDIVEVAPGVYREQLKLETPNVIWHSTQPGQAIIDGGWSGKDYDDKFSMVVGFGAAGITFDGFTIRNCEGRAFVAGAKAKGSVIRNLRIDNCGTSAFVLTGAVGVTVEDVVATRLGMAWEAGRRDSVAGSVIMTDAVRCAVRRCVVLYGWGEGINCGRGCVECEVEGCTVGDCAHLGLYVNNAVGCSLVDNVVFQSGWRGREVGEGAPAGIVIGDEGSERMQGHADSSRTTVEGNVVINCGALFHVRNNARNYDTRLDGETRIVNNTLVGGRLTRVGMQIDPNEQGRAPHGPALIANNAIDLGNAPGAVAVRGGAGLRWRANAWSVEPAAVARGEGDVVRALGLANVGATIANQFPGSDVNLSLDNYRPAPGSPVILAEGVLGALEPLPEEPPEEPPVDWDALLERAATIAEQLAVVNMAAEAATDVLGELLLKLGEYNAA